MIHRFSWIYFLSMVLGVHALLGQVSDGRTRWKRASATNVSLTYIITSSSSLSMFHQLEITFFLSMVTSFVLQWHPYKPHNWILIRARWLFQRRGSHSHGVSFHPTIPTIVKFKITVDYSMVHVFRNIWHRYVRFLFLHRSTVFSNRKLPWQYFEIVSVIRLMLCKDFPCTSVPLPIQQDCRIHRLRSRRKWLMISSIVWVALI